VGTVTADPWKGNDPSTLPYNQRIWRHGEHLLENNLGLPGIGAARVRRVLQGYDLTDQHMRLNWMSTPQKQGDELLLDLQHTVYQLRELVDSFELNISCPNTSHGGEDSRSQYQKSLDAMLQAVTPLLQGKDLYLKIMPDLDRDEVKQILEICSHYDQVKGFTISNTTKRHKNSEGKVFGGGSGDFVYDLATIAQTYFAEEIEANYSDKDWTLNACGGIKNLERLRERIQIGNVKEIHLFTPLIYEGPKLIREFRRGADNDAA